MAMLVGFHPASRAARSPDVTLPDQPLDVPAEMAVLGMDAIL
jgi:hypothetical protein